MEFSQPIEDTALYRFNLASLSTLALSKLVKLPRW